MRFSAAALATALGGRLEGPDVAIDGVATNTRDLGPGQLFVPLRDRRDGHDFIADAQAAGAVAYLTEGPTTGSGTAIVVADTAEALLTIGALARDRLEGHVIGITGSVGKTTVKDLTHGACAAAFSTQASYLSFNNEIGLPLTLANAPEDVQVVVAEMGARGVGHIAALCRIARPHVGIITRIGLAHTEFFGTIEQVAAAKAELLEALPADGIGVLNGDDPMTPMLRARCAAPVLTFGVGEACDVRGTDVRLNDQAQASFTATSPWGAAEVQLAVHGRHQVPNALAALAAALWVGAPLPDAVAALGRVGPAPWRMSVQTLGPGIVLVNDSYNANPTSTEAALQALHAIPAERRIAVLGTMAELGEDSGTMHTGVRALAESLGIDLIGYRTADYGGQSAESTDGVLARIDGLRRGDAILVKGSRAAAMETVAAAIAASVAAT